MSTLRRRGLVRRASSVVMGVAVIMVLVLVPQGAASAQDANRTCGRVDRSCCVERVHEPRRVSRQFLGSVLEVEATITCNGTARILGMDNSFMEVTMFDADGDAVDAAMTRLRYVATSATVRVRYFCESSGRTTTFHGGAWFDYHWRNSQRHVEVDTVLHSTNWSGYC